MRALTHQFASAAAVLLLAFGSAADAQTLEQIEAYEKQIEAQQRQLDALREELEALKAKVAENDVETDGDAQPFVARRTDYGELTLGGRIHRVMMHVDDGADQQGFFMDSEQGPTMLRADFNTKAADDWSLSAHFEVGIQSNRPFRVSQDNPNPGTDITVREAEVVLKSDGAGKFSFGRGFVAAWIIPELDLSGTVPSVLLGVGHLAPGMKFVDSATGDLSSVTVSQHFVDTERLLLSDRFRYDSPIVGDGFQMSGTIAADSRWDAALRYYPSFDDWSFRAIATYQSKPFRDIEDRYDLGFSALHKATGLNATAIVSRGEASDGRTGRGWVVKGGWRANLNDLGYTAFSIDYTSLSDVTVEGDESDSMGFFVQQNWADFGLDLYGGLRRYEVDRPDIALEPLDVLALGVVYTF